MTGFFAFIASALALTSAVMAQTIPPGTDVNMQLTSQEGFCFGAVTNSAGAEILVEPCGAPFTTFLLSGGSGNNQQLVLASTTLCVTARGATAGNTPLTLDFCEDDGLQRWTIPGAAGEVSSHADATKCITVTATGQGDPVTYNTCTGSVGQEWTPVVV